MGHAVSVTVRAYPLWVVPLLVAAATLVLVQVGTDAEAAGMLAFGWWIVLPYAAIALLLVLGRRLTRTAWWIGLVGSVLVTAVGGYWIYSLLTGRDAQTALVVVFGPLLQLTALGVVVLVAAVTSAVQRRRRTT